MMAQANFTNPLTPLPFGDVAALCVPSRDGGKRVEILSRPNELLTILLLTCP